MTTATTTLPPPPTDDLPEFVNLQPGKLLPKAFPRVRNFELQALVGLHLSARQWDVIVVLMMMILGASRMQAAADSCEGHDAFWNASDDFGCEAVAVESWQIARELNCGHSPTAADREQVRRVLRQLAAAKIVRVHRRGSGGRGFSRETQVLSLNLDPATWNADGLRERPSKDTGPDK